MCLCISGVQIAFHLISAWLILIFIGSKFEWKKRINLPIKIVINTVTTILIASLAMMDIVFKPFSNIVIIYGVNFLSLLGYLLLTRKGSLLNKIYWITLIQSISSSIIIILILLVENSPIIEFTLIHESIEFIIVETILLLTLGSVLYIVKHCSPKFDQLNSSVTFVLIIVNILWYCIIRYIYHLFDIELAALASFTLILSYIARFIMLDVAIQKTNRLNEVERDYENIKLKTKYFDEVEMINKQVRGYRHDLANHLNLLYYYLNVKKYDEAIHYLEQMDGDLKKIHKGFYYVETQNDAINYIINSKILIAREKGIDVEVSIDPLKDLFISSTHLCTLLANLLDNAIEACELYNQEDAFIKIDIHKIKGNFIINICNSSIPVRTDEFGNYLTNKKIGDHGLGILQIDRIIKEYEGFVSRKYNENVFETNILIPWIQA